MEARYGNECNTGKDRSWGEEEYLRREKIQNDFILGTTLTGEKERKGGSGGTLVRK